MKTPAKKRTRSKKTGKRAFSGHQLRDAKKWPQARANALPISNRVPLQKQIASGELIFEFTHGKFSKEIKLPVREKYSQLVAVLKSGRNIVIAKYFPEEKAILLDSFDGTTGWFVASGFFKTNPSDITHMRLSPSLQGHGISDKLFAIAEQHAASTVSDRKVMGGVFSDKQLEMLPLLKRAGYSIRPSRDMQFAEKKVRSDERDNLNKYYKILITNPKNGKEQYLSWKKK